MRPDENSPAGRLARWRGILAGGAALLHATGAAAQEAGGGSVFQGTPRTSAVDIAIVVVLVGLALFAVCRSSRRA